MNFEKDFYWHDSELTNIIINRSDPGNIDEIILEIDWYDTGPGKIIFEDVCFARLTLNMAIIARESIDNAFISQDDTDTLDFYKKWKRLMDDWELNCYVIKTSSTASEIKIVAKNFRVE